MRDDHQAVERAVAARGEQAAAQDDRPGVAHHAPLAAPLALDRRHHLLRRPRLGHIDRAAAALDHQEREREVVAHDGVDLDVGVAPDRVDRAVARRHRRQRRLLGAQPQLVAPVDALLVGPGVRDEADLAARVADLRVGEGGREPRQRVRLPARVGVREREQVPAGGADGRVLRAHLAAARQREHLVGPGGARALGGGVGVRLGAAVDRDDQLEAVARPVERERVGDLRRDHVLLAVGGDDQRHLRRRRARPGARPARRRPSAAEAPGTGP